MNLKRIIFDLVLFLIIILLPWWCSAALAIVGLFVFPFYWEIIFAAFLLDNYYLLETNFWSWEAHIFGLVSIIILLLAKPLKDRLKFY